MGVFPKKCIPIVYASSSAVYGNFPSGDDRHDKFDILSPYALDKLTMKITLNYVTIYTISHRLD